MEDQMDLLICLNSVTNHQGEVFILFLLPFLNFAGLECLPCVKILSFCLHHLSEMTNAYDPCSVQSCLSWICLPLKTFFPHVELVTPFQNTSILNLNVYWFMAFLEICKKFFLNSKKFIILWLITFDNDVIEVLSDNGAWQGFLKRKSMSVDIGLIREVWMGWLI